MRFYIGIILSFFIGIQPLFSQWELVQHDWVIPQGLHYLLVDGERVGITMPFAAQKTTDTWRSDFQWKYSYRGESEFQAFPGSETVCVTPIGKLFSVQKAGKSRLVIENNQMLEWVNTQDNNCNDCHPFYDAESKVLVFASDRVGGSGGYDLYKMILTSSGWSVPFRLSNAINTGKDEKFPMIAQGDLYFSSLSENGDWDIFHSPKSEFWLVRWQMEYPINSDHDEFQWWPVGDDLGWLISNRESSGIQTKVLELRRTGECQEKRICLEVDSLVSCQSTSQGQLWQEKGKRFCLNVKAGHFYHWKFSDLQGKAMVGMPVTIKDGQGNVVAVLYTDDQGQLGWQYLPFAFSSIQWWNEPDQSQLLASSDPVVLMPEELVDSTEIFFEIGSSEISDKGQKELLQMAFYLMLNSEREVWIRGSTDPTGNLLLNEKLAWERAWKVQNFLLAHGVLVAQMNVDIINPVSASIQEKERKVSLMIR